MSGRLIVIEGTDGCGKSTLGKDLAKKLDALLIEFPCNDTVTGPVIREYLRHGWAVRSDSERVPVDERYAKDSKLSALAFQALQITNRMEKMSEINEALNGGRDVVCVRYWQSAWVYGQLDGLDPDWLVQVHRAMVHPDYCLLLDLDSAVAMQRRSRRDGDLPPERYEGKLEFTRKVRELYLSLWRARKPESMWPVLDATLRPATLLDEAVAVTSRSRLYSFACFKCGMRFRYTLGDQPLAQGGRCKGCGAYGGFEIRNDKGQLT